MRTEIVRALRIDGVRRCLSLRCDAVMRPTKVIASFAVVVFAALACGGSVAGPWEICATHHDAASCATDNCLWLVAPSSNDVCDEPSFTPIATDGCFEDWAWGLHRSSGCESNDECPTGTRCIAKSFLDGATMPSCDYANLCIAQ